jgi:hypothetical protein
MRERPHDGKQKCGEDGENKQHKAAWHPGQPTRPTPTFRNASHEWPAGRLPFAAHSRRIDQAETDKQNAKPGDRDAKTVGQACERLGAYPCSELAVFVSFGSPIRPGQSQACFVLNHRFPMHS